MPEQWSCGHCGLIVEIPPERDLDLYGAAIMFIREHREGHWINRVVDAFKDGSDEALWNLCGDDQVPKTTVTSDDVAPAVTEAEAIVRRGA